MQDLVNGTYLYVLKDIARQATSILDDSVATYLKEGEAVIADASGKLLTTTAASYTGKDEMYVYYMKGGKVIKSPVLSASNLKEYKVVPYEATVQKVVYVGYNGTDGCLENNTFIPGTDYMVTLKQNSMLGHVEDNIRKIRIGSYYNELITSGEAKVAAGLVKSLVENLTDSHNATNYANVTMVASGASTAATAALKFTNGSELAIGTAAHGITAGMYIRMSTTLTDAVYKVKEVTTKTITLDTPFQGVSASVTVRRITTPATSAFGLKFIGNTAKFAVGKFNYDISNFTILLTNFDDTLVRTATAPNIGNGIWKQVAELEWELEQSEGYTNRRDSISSVRTILTDSSKCYDLLSLSTANNKHTGLNEKIVSPYTIIFAIPQACTQGDAAGSATVAPGIATALDLWLTANLPGTYNEDAKL